MHVLPIHCFCVLYSNTDISFMGQHKFKTALRSLMIFFKCWINPQKLPFVRQSKKKEKPYPISSYTPRHNNFPNVNFKAIGKVLCVKYRCLFIIVNSILRAIEYLKGKFRSFPEEFNLLWVNGRFFSKYIGFGGCSFEGLEVWDNTN